MSFEIIFVIVCMIAMLLALIFDLMRPGMILLSIVVLFLCAGILTPKEMLEGFSNKGMITVALLFLVSEGVRQSGAQRDNQEVAAAKACVGDARAVAIFAGDFGDFGVSQQHAGCRNFCAYHQALG